MSWLHHVQGWQRWVLGALVFYGVWLMVLYALQRTMVFPGAGTGPQQPATLFFPDMEILWHTTSEGPVEAWYVPGQGASADAPAPLVVFAHGNAEYLDDNRSLVASYRALGFNVLMVEFRGFGRSAGTPSERGIASDFLAMTQAVEQRPEVDGSRVVFHGRSLGGGVACALARLRKPAALVLQSTFTSIARMARSYLVPRFLVRDPFDNLGLLAGLDVPVLILHGKHDSMIPFAHAQANAKAATQSKLIAYDCDHNDCPPDSVVYWEDLRVFFQDGQILR